MASLEPQHRAFPPDSALLSERVAEENDGLFIKQLAKLLHLSWEQARDSESLLKLVAAKVVLPKTLSERGEIHPGVPAERETVITVINNNIMMKRCKNALPAPKIKSEDNSNAVQKRGEERVEKDRQSLHVSCNARSPVQLAWVQRAPIVQQHFQDTIQNFQKMNPRCRVRFIAQ